MPELSGIPLDSLGAAQQQALIRLHLATVGVIHALVGAVTETARAAILRAAGGPEQPFAAAVAVAAQQAITPAWAGFMRDYEALLAGGMEAAAGIPFGVMAAQHAALVLPVVDELREAAEAVPDFGGQLQEIVQAARQRVYSDNLTLSNRIWNLDNAGRQGIVDTLARAMLDGQSAWGAAQALEQYLGAGQDCPRWARARLRDLTKADIASSDPTGLMSGDQCRGQGVAYNALRLARNEIQTVHHMATDTLFARVPWIEQERVHLSTQHPKPDICDDVAGGGEKDTGIYPKGTIALPLHVQCLCYKTAVLADAGIFSDRLRGWLRGTAGWPEMDAYSRMIGSNMGANLLRSGAALIMRDWLWGQVSGLIGGMGLETLPAGGL